MLRNAVLTFAVISALLSAVTWMSSCKDDPAPIVTITGFSPASAFAGEIVTITGNHFSNTLTDNDVNFNGTSAEVVTATATTLTVKVPATATSGKISITVNGNTTTTKTDFIVLKTAISGFTPSSGFTGTTVNITGTNFSPALANNLVTFNGVAAVVSSAAATQLTVLVPETATTGKITVITEGRTATSISDFTVLQTTITGFSPSSGFVGTTVTITGTNFNPTSGANEVSFGNTVATVSQATQTQLTVTVPADAATGKISVTIAGRITTSATDFIVLAPTITGFTPSSAQVGTQLTINGTNFSTITSENTVKFIDGVSATVVTATATQLIVTVPNGIYSGKISVTANGKTVISAADFTLLSPSITSFFPALGVPTIPVVITGSNFSPVASYNIVKFNGALATVTAATATQLNVTVPAGVTSGKISVQAGSGTAISQFDFEPCNNSELVISNVTTNNINAGGTSFTLSFKLTNVGAVAADLTKIAVQGYVSSNDAYDTGDPDIGNFVLAGGGTLTTGQSYQVFYNVTLTGGNTVTTHPYVTFLFYSHPTGAVTECNVANNVDVKRIE